MLCELLGKTKQAYYKSQSEHKLLEEMREKAALDFVKEVRQQAPGIGLVKLWYMYNREDRGELRIGRDKFVRFMRAMIFRSAAEVIGRAQQILATAFRFTQISYEN